MEKKEYDVIIIGGGPAGAAAALYTARASLSTLVLDMAKNAGALGITSKIANYPGIKDVLSGEELLGRMWEHAQLYGAEFKKEKVAATDLSGEVKSVYTASGNEYKARAVILATGSMGRTVLLEGEKDLIGKGVSYCATCDAAFFKDKEVLVYGNNDHAYEEAEVLGRFARRVHFVAPKEARKEKLPVNSEIYENSRLTKVLGETKVAGAAVTTPQGAASIPVDGVFIYTSGNKPVTDYLYGSVPADEKSCLLVSQQYETAIPGVFACGDILCNEVQQAVVSAAQGCIAALSADKYLRGRKTFAKDYR